MLVFREIYRMAYHAHDVRKGVLASGLLLLFICDTVAGYAENDESKTKEELFKIELSKSGHTVITIGNLWKLGQRMQQKMDSTISPRMAIMPRATEAIDFENMRSARRFNWKSYHTTLIPMTPPTIVTTRKFMQVLNVKDKTTPGTNRMIPTPIRIAPVRASFKREEVKTSPNEAFERFLTRDSLRKFVDNHYGWNVINSEDVDCGESYSDRIIGGTETSLGQFPWIARLGYTVKPNMNMTEYRCGGVLIAQNFVLTAAHCVSNLGPRTTLATVRLGEHDITKIKDCQNEVCAAPVQDFRPVNVTPHADFMKRKYGSDVAIIKLDRSAVYNGWVSPVCLPKGNLLAHNFSGQSGDVAGWGIMNMDTQKSAPRLRSVSLPFLTLDHCQREYKNKVKLTDEQFCAGGVLDKDACGGDSGGPLMKVVDENGPPQYFLLGIVSFGPSNCGKKEPGVFANVSFHMPWILDQIQTLS